MQKNTYLRSNSDRSETNLQPAGSTLPTGQKSARNLLEGNGHANRNLFLARDKRI